MLRFPRFHPKYSRTCLHMRTPTHAQHTHSLCKIAMWWFFCKKNKMERKLIWRSGWQTPVCETSSGFSKVKEKVFVFFCFVLRGCSLVLVCVCFPLAEIEVNAKGEWSSTGGRCSKIYPRSGRGRVEWSLALVVLRMGGCQAIGWTHTMCASPAGAPRPTTTRLRVRVSCGRFPEVNDYFWNWSVLHALETQIE